ncbi:MAG: T9SS type A sorting domain-containing protein, partial [Candidatus Cloacimonetes bacterium]|nr:T9SS type A sorting domain-containing protein [Candidatus Cloacimonadota bacterium]
PSFNNNLVAMQSYAYISEDYGYNWTRLDSVYNVFDVTNSEYDPDVYIASRIKRGIYMSYDGAQTWIESNNGIAEEDRLLIDKAYFLSENTMIFSGFKSNEGEHNQTFIYRSEDQGLSWNLIMESDLNLGEPMISIQALCKVDDIFYTALLSGIIMKSEDYGLTWEYTFEIENRKFRQLLYDFQNSIFYIRAVDTEAIPGKYIIYRSYDSFNWEECSYSFHNDFSTFNISLNPNEPGDIFASVRNRDGIELEHPHFYYSHNCGDSWQPVYLDGFSPTDYIVTMNIIPETNEMLICPGESSIFRNELNFVSACNEIITNITPINLTNYPNPFTSETTISFSLTDEKAESTEICIYNIKGQKVKQFPDIENQNSITWNATDEYDKQVSNGVYFYKLRVNNINKAVRKMILIR